MADEKHLKILKLGVKDFNNWRNDNPDRKPDLIKANLSGMNLSGANFSGADLSGADLSGADLSEANLSMATLIKANLFRVNLGSANLSEAKLKDAYLCQADLSAANLSEANLSYTDLTETDFTEADLRGAILRGADLTLARLDNEVNLRNADLRDAYLGAASLYGADLSGVDFRGAEINGANFGEAILEGANLRGADFSKANLFGANLRGADLYKTNLELANLVETNLKGTNISNSRIYGISAWNLKFSRKTKQLNLIITRSNEPVITVDNLEVAQFLYLLLNNERIRNVINTITTKAVLILGRFTEKRKNVLDAIREELRKHDYVPILFDFDKPSTRDTHETITTLARMARFVIADITNPKSIPQELTSIVEQLPSLPVKPLLRYGAKRWAMYDHISRYPWVLPIFKYRNIDDLIGSLKDRVILPAENEAMKSESKI
jgi:uncharacterized protein YjbI with pentapeptide repeats